MAIIKNTREIALIKKAADISNSCIPVIKKALEEGVTEREMSRRVRRKIYSQGGRLSFRTLVACGDRSAMIHPKPAATGRMISGIGYVDFGASWKGYKSDVTIPFVKGRVGYRERKIIKTVINAYRIALKTWKPGMPCWVLHDRVEARIRSAGFRMGHALGHGVGKKIHENPIIVATRRKLKGKRLARWERFKRARFQDGMVFTIEPGAYVKGFGGCRIENTFLINRKSLKSLTKSNLIEV